MLSLLKSIVKKTPFARPFIFLKGKVTRPHSQNDEARIISRLVDRFNVPHCFVEFGFGGWEFNCAELAYDWDGLLLDGDAYNVTIARTLFPRRVKAERVCITLETLETINRFATDREIGILSVDVDGNDYWFVEKLLPIRPAILVVEYNSSLGLRPLSIPYDPAFYYRNYDTIFYYGASLVAFDHLAKAHGYSLIEVQKAGINAFFVRDDLLGPNDRPLDPTNAYRAQAYPDGSSPEDRWEQIEHMPFIDVTAAPRNPGDRPAGPIRRSS